MKARGVQDDRGWDHWMASLTQCIWVWASPGDDEGHGSLAFCSLWVHRVRHDLMTEQQLGGNSTQKEKKK